MRFLGLVTAIESRSYERGKEKLKVEEVTLTCLDFDKTNIRLKDTVDVILPKSDFSLIQGQPIGQQVWFDVQEVKPNPYGPRLRFYSKIEITQFQAGGEGVPTPPPTPAKAR